MAVTFMQCLCGAAPVGNIWRDKAPKIILAFWNNMTLNQPEKGDLPLGLISLQSLVQRFSLMFH